MSDSLRAAFEGKELSELHERAESMIADFRYVKPPPSQHPKGQVRLAHGEILKAIVQVIKKDGGENNLHYHTSTETLWWVVRGRVRFYGPGDHVLGEYGPNEGIITPRYARYWFECAGDEDLEMLQLAASDVVGHKSGRKDAEARHALMDRGDWAIDLPTGAAVKS